MVAALPQIKVYCLLIIVYFGHKDNKKLPKHAEITYFFRFSSDLDYTLQPKALFGVPSRARENLQKSFTSSQIDVSF